MSLSKSQGGGPIDALSQAIQSYLNIFRQAYRLLAAYVDYRSAHYERIELIIVTAVASLVSAWLYRFMFKPNKSLIARLKKAVFKLVRRIPMVRDKIASEMAKNNEGFLKQFHGTTKGLGYVQRLPAKGLNKDEVLTEVQKYKKMVEIDWADGQVSGVVYNGEQDLTALMTTVYGEFAWTNPLHSDVFPDVRKMEAEVVRMTCNMFQGSDSSCGVITSGGTESIMLACVAYRNLAYDRGIEYPEMVIPHSAHAAFDKSAECFNIKITHIPVDKRTRQVDIAAMRRAINKNTCMLLGSAPQYPHGILDPITEIAKLGLEHNIPVHVDSCLGGFLVPFMKKAGYHLPPFDFSVPGVTSISADVHKYGFAPKGCSVVMYSDIKYRHYHFFTYPDWTGGIYGSPTFAGSRSGAIIAACWATMMYIGEDGYVDSTRRIVETAKYIADGIRKLPHIFVYGDPQLSVVGMGSHDFNIYRLLDMMTKKGWNLNALQFPMGVHICCTLVHTKADVADRFLDDVKSSVTEIMNDKSPQEGGQAAVYGMAQSIPDRSLVGEIVGSFFDAYYSTQ